MLHLIVWVVVGLLALSFFGISIRAIANSPTSQDNFSFLIDTLRMGWDYMVAWVQTLMSDISNLGS